MSFLRPAPSRRIRPDGAYQTDDNRGHLLGTLVFASMLGHPINWTFPGRPTWGSASKDADRDFFNHSMKLGVMVQDLPRETNRVDLDPDVKDGWGMPVARITHTAHSNDFAQAKWQVNKNVEILEAAGASKVIPSLRSVPGVLDVEQVLLRWVGHRMRAETGVVVDPQLDVVAAHDIAVQAHHQLLHDIPRLREAIVHVSPGGEHGTEQHRRLAHHQAAAR